MKYLEKKVSSLSTKQKTEYFKLFDSKCLKGKFVINLLLSTYFVFKGPKNLQKESSEQTILPLAPSPQTLSTGYS